MAAGYCDPIPFNEIMKAYNLKRPSPAPIGPDKGSLDMRCLRTRWSHYPSRYSRGVFNTGWHEDRQTEPKDMDINREPTRNMFASTYDRIATFTDGSLPMTTYQEHSLQWKLKPYYTERPYRQPLVDDRTHFSSKLKRETGRPKTGYAAVLPDIPPVLRQYMTTHVDHYRRPFPPLQGPQDEIPRDHSRAIRHMLSQFTDVDNHRRVGRNHWHDESGLYANSHLRPECPYYEQRPAPFACRLV